MQYSTAFLLHDLLCLNQVKPVTVKLALVSFRTLAPPLKELKPDLRYQSSRFTPGLIRSGTRTKTGIILLRKDYYEIQSIV